MLNCRRAILFCFVLCDFLLGIRLGSRVRCSLLHLRSDLFFLSLRYWRYNEDMRTMDPGYPKPITVWKGIPDSPQGAFVDKANGRF